MYIALSKRSLSIYTVCSIITVVYYVQTGCVPWDYPIPPGFKETDLKHCTAFSDGKTYNNSRYAFEMAMDDSSIFKTCSEQCESNCEETAYDVQIDTTTLEAEELCKNGQIRDVRK